MANEVEIERLVTRFEADLSDMKRDMARVEKMAGGAADKVGRRFALIGRSVRGAIAGLGFATAGKGILDVNIQFDQLEARLRSLTRGDAPLAKAAFEDLFRLSRMLPFQVDEVTNAFTRLNRLGFDASASTLLRFADIASAVGTKGAASLTQVVEALADVASGGGTERMKELNINMQREGNKLIATFGNIRKEIGTDAASIQNFLLELARMEFAGAASEQMNTLGAALGNLADSWRAAARTIGEAGLNETMVDLSNFISNQVGPAVGWLVTQFRAFGDVVGGLAAAAVADLTGDMEGARRIIEDVFSGDRRRALEREAPIRSFGAARQPVAQRFEEKNSTQVLRTLRSIDGKLTFTNVGGAVLQ